MPRDGAAGAGAERAGDGVDYPRRARERRAVVDETRAETDVMHTFVTSQVLLVSEENTQRQAAVKMLEAASYRGARGRAPRRRPGDDDAMTTR